MGLLRIRKLIRKTIVGGGLRPIPGIFADCRVTTIARLPEPEPLLPTGIDCNRGQPD